MQQEQDTIGLAFSVISYLRCLFSEDSFQECKFNDLTLKALKNTSETRKINEWISNINRHKENIHKIVIGIYSLDNFKDGDMSLNRNISESNEKLVEMYSFNINIQPDFKELCRTLQAMKILRGRFIIKLKVYTTSFVEINGFKRTDKLWEYNHLDRKELKGFNIFSEEFTNIETEEKVKTSGNINCCCTINTNENQMIQCTKCSKWVHASCYGYFSSKDKRIDQLFICYDCLQIQSKELRDCAIYRRVLSVIYNEKIPTSRPEDIAKIDKPTAFGNNSTMNSKNSSNLNRSSVINFLKERLKLSTTFADQVLRKLTTDGFIVFENRNYQVVKTREVKEKIKFYFNGKRMECLIAICDINCDIKE